jgi:very-short-patch-repair endonuclease
VSGKSAAEEVLANHLEWSGVKDVVRELRFHPTRRWRFDFSIPRLKIAIEVEGATWARGRHTRGSGFEKDCEKYNEATIMGWRVLRFTTDMVISGEAIAVIERAIKELGTDEPILQKNADIPSGRKPRGEVV